MISGPESVLLVPSTSGPWEQGGKGYGHQGTEAVHLALALTKFFAVPTMPPILTASPWDPGPSPWAPASSFSAPDPVCAPAPSQPAWLPLMLQIIPAVA